MKNVLIFPGGSEIGLEINNALKYSKMLTVYGGTSVKDHAQFVYSRCIEDIPYLTEPDFIERFNQVIERYDIDFVYPAMDNVLMFLTDHRSEIKADVITSDHETCRICRSKSLTYEYFAGEDFIPRTYSSADEVDAYPVFVKPSEGCGSIGAAKAGSREELELRLAQEEGLVVCEYLPGMEYTIDCFTDRHGKLRVARMRDRGRIKSGISVHSSHLPVDDAVMRIADTINSRMKFDGAWFFQLKRNLAGQYRLLEISARVPGTMGVSRNAGINFPLLTIYNHLGCDVEIIDNGYSVTVDRALIGRYDLSIDYDTVYVDLDDTLIIRGEVNTFLMMYLYQQVNRSRKLILLTKHAVEVADTFRKHRISLDLFDEIIHIEQGVKKSAYITEKNAVFIDDSFAERLDVSSVCGIPVFDVSEVESLYDWRM